MYIVTGYVDDVAYTVTVDPDPDEPVPDNAVEHGRAYGTARIMALLRQVERRGESVAATPVGPGPYRPGTPEGILAALYVYTQVVAVEGDAPEVYPPQIAGQVQ